MPWLSLCKQAVPVPSAQLAGCSLQALAVAVQASAHSALAVPAQAPQRAQCPGCPCASSCPQCGCQRASAPAVPVQASAPSAPAVTATTGPAVKVESEEMLSEDELVLIEALKFNFGLQIHRHVHFV